MDHDFGNLSEPPPRTRRRYCDDILMGANWAIGQFVPMMISGLGLAYTFWIFAVINILCFLFVVTICPETKNKSLEEIEKLWIK